MSKPAFPSLPKNLADRASWLVNAGSEDTRQGTAAMTGTDDDIAVLRAAIDYEKAHSNRVSRLDIMQAKLRRFTDSRGSTITKAVAAEVTTALPKDPRWDEARKVSDQLRLCGRLYLRGQVKLGMILSALKKEFGITRGQPKKNSPDSGEYLPWDQRVKQETGYSRQSCDEFIRLYDATKAKLKNAKKLDLPAPAKKDALVLFKTENPLALSDKQWEQVDAVISSLTTGETQITLMQELGIVPKPKAMPKGTKPAKDGDDDTPAGQLAFHFFDAVAAPLINARTNPDYKKLLLCLPFESDEENPLSLATLEAEARALIADIEEVKQKSHKPTRGRIINV
jgi:hypothetical protein